MNKILEINDLKRLAKKKLPKMFYDYIDTGSYAGITYESNEEDFKKIKLKQRVGINIKNRDLSTYILGKKYALPLGLAPAGMGGMMDPNGEILVAQACSNMNIPYILSTMSICAIEQVAENSKNPFWFQLFVRTNVFQQLHTKVCFPHDLLQYFRCSTRWVTVVVVLSWLNNWLNDPYIYRHTYSNNIDY